MTGQIWLKIGAGTQKKRQSEKKNKKKIKGPACLPTCPHARLPAKYPVPAQLELF
jgi:hypothetical protein